MEVRSQEQFEEATQFRLEFGRHIWLGGSDSQEEGVWVWDSNNEEISNEFWISSIEPNGGSRENCLGFLYNDEDAGYFSFFCDRPWKFLCEFN